jgi:hypothetical protein
MDIFISIFESEAGKLERFFIIFLSLYANAGVLP